MFSNVVVSGAAEWTAGRKGGEINWNVDETVEGEGIGRIAREDRNEIDGGNV